ncbi:MAG TPA: DbpA RNA binding domain-containing protein [Gemmatimonadaceae bacterium]|nr:DbpA RNA binding domain-containing protein [Gemmatimonadaceae bacterium]
MTSPDSRDASSVARNQHVVYVLPHDRASVAEFLGPALDRLDVEGEGLQLLVITADADTAVMVAWEAGRLAGDRPLRIVAATGGGRTERRLRAGGAHMVAGSARDLGALLRASALKTEAVRVVALAWLDETLAVADVSELEALMGELPKEAPRVLVAARITAEVEAFIERYLRRARRVAEGAPAGDEPSAPPTIEFVTTSRGARAATLRRLLDALDPERAAVVARSEESEHEVGATLRALGYGGADAAVVSARGAAPEGASVVVLYDVPSSRQELREMAGGAERIVALVGPRQLVSLRESAPGAAVRALTLPGAAARAREAADVLRDELRATLAAGVPERELLALEPLLDDYDGIEVAAAALRLLDAARRAAPAEAPPVAKADRAAKADRTPRPERGDRSERPDRGDRDRGERAERGERPPRERAERRPRDAGGDGGEGDYTRLYFNLGHRDEIRPGDLVGAIIGEAGITSAQIGRIELRDNHSLVEVASDRAEEVAEKMTGRMVRGRRVVSRVDADAGQARPRERSFGRGPREGGERRPPRRDFGDDRRPPRRDGGESRRPSFGRSGGGEDRPRRFARDRDDRGGDDRPRFGRGASRPGGARPGGSRPGGPRPGARRTRPRDEGYGDGE